VDEIYTKLRKEKRAATADEQKLIDEVEAAREIIIQVRKGGREGGRTGCVTMKSRS